MFLPVYYLPFWIHLHPSFSSFSSSITDIFIFFPSQYSSLFILLFTFYFGYLSHPSSLSHEPLTLLPYQNSLFPLFFSSFPHLLSPSGPPFPNPDKHSTQNLTPYITHSSLYPSFLPSKSSSSSSSYTKHPPAVSSYLSLFMDLFFPSGSQCSGNSIDQRNPYLTGTCHTPNR